MAVGRYGGRVETATAYDCMRTKVRVDRIESALKGQRTAVPPYRRTALPQLQLRISLQ